MTPRTKKTAAALSGALVLASGAYALGSQTGDGQALAGQKANAQQGGYGFGYGPGPGKHGFRGGPRQDLADAAKKLGVSQDKLLAALKNLRDDRKGKLDDLRDAFEKALAKQLGIPESKVESALDKRAGDRQGGRKLKRDGHRGDMRDAFAKQLAAKLGITEAKVRAALDAQRKAGPPGPPDLSALAIVPPPSALWDRILVGLDPTPTEGTDTPPAPPLHVLRDPLATTEGSASEAPVHAPTNAQTTSDAPNHQQPSTKGAYRRALRHRHLNLLEFHETQPAKNNERYGQHHNHSLRHWNSSQLQL